MRACVQPCKYINRSERKKNLFYTTLSSKESCYACGCNTHIQKYKLTNCPTTLSYGTLFITLTNKEKRSSRHYRFTVYIYIYIYIYTNTGARDAKTFGAFCVIESGVMKRGP